MITKTAPAKITQVFPLEKTDIHYDPSREEVTIPREKFDAFVRYVAGLQEKLEAAEDARDVARYRAQKAGKSADVLEGLIRNVQKASAAIREWLGAGNTLQELSDRSRIPYATCHRIVNERLGTEKVEIGHLQKLVAAISRTSGIPTVTVSEAKHVPRFGRVLLGLPKDFRAEELVSGWEIQGSKVETMHAGVEIASKVKELHPDLILLDVSMPSLGISGLEQLKEVAKDKKTTVVLTGKIAEDSSALFTSWLDFGKQTKESEREAESARG
jgi:CheY-like chemotaxis protein